MNPKKIKVLIAKPGLDGHDRGAIAVAQALRDAGMEVIYTGIRQTPRQIVETAIQEDVAVLGLSCLSGAHLSLFKEITSLLKKEKVKGLLIFAGGIIPDSDIPKIKKMGVREVFAPGSPLTDIVALIQKSVRAK